MKFLILLEVSHPTSRQFLAQESRYTPSTQEPEKRDPPQMAQRLRKYRLNFSDSHADMVYLPAAPTNFLAKIRALRRTRFGMTGIFFTTQLYSARQTAKPGI
jgi:hypothetical protein